MITIKNNSDAIYRQEHGKAVRRMFVGAIAGFIIFPLIINIVLYFLGFFNNKILLLFDHWSPGEWVIIIFLVGGTMGSVLGALLSLFSRNWKTTNIRYISIKK